MASAFFEQQVQQLYIAYFGRPADRTGLDFYANSLELGTTTIEAVASSFAVSDEAQLTINSLTTIEFIQALYLQAFARDYLANADGTFWLDAIENGVTTKELAFIQILQGAQNDDIIAVNHKVAVAQNFTANVNDADYVGPVAAAEAKALLDAVTADPATLPPGVEPLPEVDPPVEPDPDLGEEDINADFLTDGIFTLNADGVDQNISAINLTSGTINANLAGGNDTLMLAELVTTATLNIDFGTGNDTLFLSSTNLFEATLNLSNLENINLSGFVSFEGSQLNGKNYNVILDEFSGGTVSVTATSQTGETTDLSDLMFSNTSNDSFTTIINVEETGGQNTIIGTSENDSFSIRGGDNVLTGGAGADLYRITPSDEGPVRAIITDFEVGLDLLDQQIGTFYDGGAADIAVFLTNALGLSVSSAQVTEAYAGSFLEGTFVYDGNVHVVFDGREFDPSIPPFGESVGEAGDYSPGDTFITLLGVGAADVNSAADIGVIPNEPLVFG